MTDNPACVCGHTRSHHQGSLGPHCHFVRWPTYERGGGLCDCTEFAIRPKSSELRDSMEF